MKMRNTGAAWLPDGREFVFGSGAGTDTGLSRIAASNGAMPKRISLDANSASEPAISRVGNRLAFATVKWDLNIWRIDLKGRAKNEACPLGSFLPHSRSGIQPNSARRSKDRLCVATIRDG